MLKFPGLSWVALGWKPQTQDKTCASIDQYSAAEKTGVPEPTSEPETTGPWEVSGATAEPEPTAEGTNIANFAHLDCSTKRTHLFQSRLTRNPPPSPLRPTARTRQVPLCHLFLKDQSPPFQLVLEMSPKVGYELFIAR